MKHRMTFERCYQNARNVARCQDRVVDIFRNADVVELLFDTALWPWGIRHEYDLAAVSAKITASINGTLKRPHAVMQHSPNIEKPNVGLATKRRDCIKMGYSAHKQRYTRRQAACHAAADRAGAKLSRLMWRGAPNN